MYNLPRTGFNGGGDDFSPRTGPQPGGWVGLADGLKMIRDPEKTLREMHRKKFDVPGRSVNRPKKPMTGKQRMDKDIEVASSQQGGPWPN